MDQEQTLRAANSRHWYEAVFRTHRLATAIADGMWPCRGVPPPYHSNAVTLAPTGLPAQFAANPGCQREGLSPPMDHIEPVEESHRLGKYYYGPRP